MSTNPSNDADVRRPRSLGDVTRELATIFARRADEGADDDRFVADNIALLKTSGLVEAGVPAELGGGGADTDQLAAMLRTARLSLRLDGARLLHALPPSRPFSLAMDS